MKIWLMIRIAVAFTWLVAVTCSASAQTGTKPFENSRSTIGGTIPLATPPTFEANAGTEVLRHRGPTGKPCLVVSGYPRAHTIDHNLYDHMITVTNACAQRIAMQVCYYRSQECIRIEVPGGERKEAILGSLPSVKDFRFEFREKF